MTDLRKISNCLVPERDPVWKILIKHLPFLYAERSEITSLSDLSPVSGGDKTSAVS